VRHSVSERSDWCRAGLMDTSGTRLREVLIDSGATTPEIDRIAASLMCMLADHLDRDDLDSREFHLELISRHLACTEITVGLQKGRVKWIRFPRRPQVH
jgi:hypothetical protein